MDRFFEHYNAHSKVSKGRGLVLKCNCGKDVFDPVFSQNCLVKGIRHW